MNIFQIKTQPHGIERNHQFLAENFICIGYPGIGDLSNVKKDEIRERLNKEYGWQSSQLGNHLGVVNAFVHTMDKGDIILITIGDWVYIGELDNYHYELKYENEGMCHRRAVNWIDKIEKFRVNEQVKELLRNRSIVTKFKHPYDVAELEGVLKRNTSITTNLKIDENIVGKALGILTRALDSDIEEIKVMAAIGITHYIK